MLVSKPCFAPVTKASNALTFLIAAYNGMPTKKHSTMALESIFTQALML